MDDCICWERGEGAHRERLWGGSANEVLIAGELLWITHHIRHVTTHPDYDIHG